MQENQSKLQNSIKYLISGLAFLLPVFFLPITVEIFDFNKLSLLIFTVSAALILWAIDVVTTKKLQIAKTPIDLPGLLLITSVFLSAIFSIDKTSSIFGRYGKWFPSLSSFFSLGVLYILITTYTKTKEDLKLTLYAFLSGTTIASLIGILSYYGVTLIEGANANFNPTGSPTTLAILAVSALLIGLHSYLDENNLPIKLFSAGTFLTNFTYLVLYNKPFGWILTALAVLAAITTVDVEKIKEKSKRLSLLLLGVAITGIIGLTLTPLTKPFIIRHTYPSRVQLPLGESWDIAISGMRDFPLVGTGPSTFYLNYPRYKSAEMNRTDYWNVRFDKPFSEALGVVATLGILGIVLGLYFDIEILKLAIGKLKEEPLIKTLAMLTILFLALFYVTSATITMAFVFTLFLGLLAAATNIEKGQYLNFSTENQSSGATTILTTKPDENAAFLTVLMTLPFLAMAGLGFFTLYKTYPAEYYMKKAINLLSTDAAQSLEYQAKAINHSPQRSNYRNIYAQTNLAMAVNLSAKENLTDTQKEALQTLLGIAIRSTKITTEAINPLDPANWEIRADIYSALRGATKDAEQWALGALETAMQLDPNNPQLRVKTGGIYYAQKDYLTAANYFRQATQLKSDYANAYYNFAQAVKNLENYASAKRALELTLNLIPQDSQDYAKVEEELTELESLIASTAQAQEDRPSVEELATEAEIEETEAVTPQEPLNIEGEEEELIEPVNLDEEGAQGKETAKEETEEKTEEKETKDRPNKEDEENTAD